MLVTHCVNDSCKTNLIILNVILKYVAGFGSSGGKCSYTYHGPAPFSEPEVEGVANFLSTIKNLKGFIDFHSYGQLWMGPYGYINELPKDYLLQVIRKQNIYHT